MADTQLNPPGQPIEANSIQHQKARALIDHIEANHCPLTNLVECFAGDGKESVVIETRVEIPQNGSRFDVRSRERIGVVFFTPDARMPEVLALRDTFPHLPHQNRRQDEVPRSLCVSDQRYEELQRRWSPRLILSLIQKWLNDAARGRLHHESQPLEPYFEGFPCHLILPAAACTSQGLRMLHIESIPGPNAGAPNALIGSLASKIENIGEEANRKRTLAVTFRTPAIEHGVIRAQPTSLDQLAKALAETGFELLRELRRELRAWKEKVEDVDVFLSRLAIVTWIPKVRNDGDSKPEASDTLAFLTNKQVFEVGEDVGAWEIHSEDGRKHIAPIIGTGDGPANDNCGEGTPVQLLPVTFQLDRQSAARMALGRPGTTLAIGIGVGALGSHVVANLQRAGFARLTIIDEDVFLPHNVARHMLAGARVGHPKARAVAEELSTVLLEEPIVESICDSVISKNPCIEKALGEADLLLDMTASVAVARFLATADSPARRVSAFLNQAGTDLVLLAEDRDRKHTIHDLEIQFYRGLAGGLLPAHFSPARGVVRYGQGCRDLSVSLAADQAALFGALASMAIRKLGEDAAVMAWRTTTDGGVQRVDVPTSPVQRISCGSWTVVIDDDTVTSLRHVREGKLPNETGGVLVGSFDLSLRTVHVADFIPSPPDSLEWPNLYVRGSSDLLRKVRRFERATDGMLTYVGEWHAHPRGTSSEPSDLDTQALDNLKNTVAPDGLPAVMLIVGESDLSVLVSDGEPHTTLFEL